MLDRFTSLLGMSSAPPANAAAPIEEASTPAPVPVPVGTPSQSRVVSVPSSPFVPTTPLAIDPPGSTPAQKLAVATLNETIELLEEHQQLIAPLYYNFLMGLLEDVKHVLNGKGTWTSGRM